MPQYHVLVTLVTVRPGMAYIAAPEIVMGCLCMAIFPGIGHPVCPGVGHGLLAPVTIRAVGCRVANSTQPAVMRGILAVLGGLPVEYVILGFLGLVTILAKILFFVTELAGFVKTALETMMLGPVAVMAWRSDLLSHLGMADLTVNRCIISIVTFLAGKHVGPFNVLQALLLIDSLVAIRAFCYAFVGLVCKYQI